MIFNAVSASAQDLLWPDASSDLAFSSRQRPFDREEPQSSIAPNGRCDLIQLSPDTIPLRDLHSTHLISR
jgi:hypothetical protein